MDHVGVDLAQRDYRPELRAVFMPVCSTADGAQLTQKCSPVAFDKDSRVVPGESQVESVRFVNAGESPQPRGKSMDQPGKFAQPIRTKDIELDFGSPLLHPSMLAEGQLEALFDGT